LGVVFIYINSKLFFIHFKERTMQRIATADQWTCTENGSQQQESAAGRVLDTIWGIIKDTLVMSVVVMMGAALTLLLG